MSDVRTFKVAIGKKTFALTFYGGSGDLDHFRTFIYTKLEWVKKRGAKAMGIYPRNNGETLVFVDTNGAFSVCGKTSLKSPVHDAPVPISARQS